VGQQRRRAVLPALWLRRRLCLPLHAGLEVQGLPLPLSASRPARSFRIGSAPFGLPLGYRHLRHGAKGQQRTPTESAISRAPTRPHSSWRTRSAKRSPLNSKPPRTCRARSSGRRLFRRTHEAENKKEDRGDRRLLRNRPASVKSSSSCASATAAPFFHLREGERRALDHPSARRFRHDRPCR